MNIWKNFNFVTKKGKSSYDIMLEQESSFIAKSRGVLTMEYTTCQSFTNEGGKLVYNLYIVSKALGGFRRNILSVTEESDTSYYPVTIKTPYTDDTFTATDEKDFIDKVKKTISLGPVKKSIESLYHLSKENM